MALEPDSRRKELCDWLTANHIEPRDVPIRGDLTVDTEDGQRVIRYEAMLSSADGRLMLDDRGEDVAIERRTVPLVVEPPDWWEPYEKPTRAQLLEVVERLRKIPRLPHSSQREGAQGRAYTRGWQSVITCIDEAILGHPADPEALEYPSLAPQADPEPQPKLEPEDGDEPVQCWHYEPGSPCDWDVCRQPERLAAGDRGTDPAWRREQP